MDAIVTIDEARMELDQNTFVPYIRFSGLLDLREINDIKSWDSHGYLIDNLAASIGHEIIKQTRFLYELSNGD